MLQRNYNPAITPQDVYNLKSKIARMDQNNTAAKSVAMRDGALTAPMGQQMLTDPTLEMHGMAMPSMIDENGARKCECQCCDHGAGDAQHRSTRG